MRAELKVNSFCKSIQKTEICELGSFLFRNCKPTNYKPTDFMLTNLKPTNFKV